MSGHEVAPYSFLVDHLASASEAKETTFSNVSSIECPARPADYVCPQMLSVSNKEELKKQLCQYETVLSGSLNLVPNTDRATTRCGALKIDSVALKSDEDLQGLTSKMAIVMGKDCSYKCKATEAANSRQQTTGAAANAYQKDQQQQQEQHQQIHLLIKASIPTSTKFILADGANMDLLSGSAISKDEIASIMKQCPKVSA